MEHRHLDHLTASGAVALEQRGGDRLRGGEAGDLVDHRLLHEHGRPRCAGRPDWRRSRSSPGSRGRTRARRRARSRTGSRGARRRPGAGARRRGPRRRNRTPGITVGRKFSTSTSAVATSLRRMARSSASLKSSAIERLPQFVFTKYADVPPRLEPTWRRMSPTGGSSTLITSAPCWARTIVANGPDRFIVRSTIRTPASGPVAVFGHRRTLFRTYSPRSTERPDESGR